MLVLGERGKPKYPDKNLSEQRREPTNSVHIMMAGQTKSNSCHIGKRRVLSALW